MPPRYNLTKFSLLYNHYVNNAERNRCGVVFAVSAKGVFRGYEIKSWENVAKRFKGLVGEMSATDFVPLFFVTKERKVISLTALKELQEEEYVERKLAFRMPQFHIPEGMPDFQAGS